MQIQSALRAKTGFCQRCQLKKFFGDVVLPSGTKYLFSERSAEGVPVVCGKCGGRRVVKNGSVRSDRPDGFCHGCASGEFSGDELHLSGAIIHWSKREPDSKFRVAFTCAGCGAEHFTWGTHIRSRKKWSGLCVDCRQRRGSYNRKKEETTLGSGSVVLYQQRKPGDIKKVAVRCGVCSSENFFTRTAIAAKGFTGYCRAHTHVEIALAFQSQDGNGQKNGDTEKKHPGPEKGFNAKITEEKVREAFKSLGCYAPQERIAEKIGVDPRSLRDWQKAQGLSYRQLRQQFTETGGS
jgi:hypothetical protein